MRKLLQNFTSFVKAQDYSDEQKMEVLTLFKKPKIRKVFLTSLILLAWAMIGILLDGFFVGGGVFATLMMGDFMPVVFLPALIYFVGNIIAKFLFIKIYLGSQISIKHSLLATLPYLGSAILFGATLRNEPLFLEVMKKYFSYLRSQGLIKVCRMCVKEVETDYELAELKVEN